MRGSSHHIVEWDREEVRLLIQIYDEVKSNPPADCESNEWSLIRRVIGPQFNQQSHRRDDIERSLGEIRAIVAHPSFRDLSSWPHEQQQSSPSAPVTLAGELESVTAGREALQTPFVPQEHQPAHAQPEVTTAHVAQNSSIVDANPATASGQSSFVGSTATLEPRGQDTQDESVLLDDTMGPIRPTNATVSTTASEQISRNVSAASMDEPARHQTDGNEGPDNPSVPGPSSQPRQSVPVADVMDSMDETDAAQLFLHLDHPQWLQVLKIKLPHLSEETIRRSYQTLKALQASGQLMSSYATESPWTRREEDIAYGAIGDYLNNDQTIPLKTAQEICTTLKRPISDIVKRCKLIREGILRESVRSARERPAADFFAATRNNSSFANSPHPQPIQAQGRPAMVPTNIQETMQSPMGPLPRRASLQNVHEVSPMNNPSMMSHPYFMTQSPRMDSAPYMASTQHAHPVRTANDRPGMAQQFMVNPNQTMYQHSFTSQRVDQLPYMGPLQDTRQIFSSNQAHGMHRSPTMDQPTTNQSSTVGQPPVTGQRPPPGRPPVVTGQPGMIGHPSGMEYQRRISQARNMALPQSHTQAGYHNTNAPEGEGNHLPIANSQRN